MNTSILITKKISSNLDGTAKCTYRPFVAPQNTTSRDRPPTLLLRCAMDIAHCDVCAGAHKLDGGGLQVPFGTPAVDVGAAEDVGVVVSRVTPRFFFFFFIGL